MDIEYIMVCIIRHMGIDAVPQLGQDPSVDAGNPNALLLCKEEPNTITTGENLYNFMAKWRLLPITDKFRCRFSVLI